MKLPFILGLFNHAPFERIFFLKDDIEEVLSHNFDDYFASA